VEINQLEDQLQPDHTQKLVSQASHLLSDLTRFAGRGDDAQAQERRIRHIEFLRLSKSASC